MRILGIDPGSHHTGWGAIDSFGSKMELVDTGVIDGGPGDLVKRLCTIADRLEEVLRHMRADAVAVETIFHAKNSQSAFQLGQARGVILLCAARTGAEIFEYSAGQIKQAVTGGGRADKEQVQTMVRLMLHLKGALRFDATDALACAICHGSMHGSRAARFLRSHKSERGTRLKVEG